MYFFFVCPLTSYTVPYISLLLYPSDFCLQKTFLLPRFSVGLGFRSPFASPVRVLAGYSAPNIILIYMYIIYYNSSECSHVAGAVSTHALLLTYPYRVCVCVLFSCDAFPHGPAKTLLRPVVEEREHFLESSVQTFKPNVSTLVPTQCPPHLNLPPLAMSPSPARFTTGHSLCCSESQHGFSASSCGIVAYNLPQIQTRSLTWVPRTGVPE